MNNYKKLIDDYIAEILPTEKDLQPQLANAVRYSIVDGGKRVRGILVLAFFQLFNPNNYKDALPVSAAVEMIHAYSLVHDDLPSMDNDLMRRGKPSNHVAFGEATALLAGDALLTMAFQQLSNTETISPKALLKCVEILSNKAGVFGMIGGQAQDLENEKTTPTAQTVEDTELKKTGALLASACMMGTVCGGGSEKDVELAEKYGYQLGLTFQIIDDILDNTSTAETLGKPINSDRENNKVTFTTIYGIEKSKELAKDKTNNAIEYLNQIGGNNEFLIEFTKYLLDRKF